MTASARAGSCPPMGDAGRNVIANVERLRKDRRLSLRQLSGRLGEAGRPILPTPLQRLVQGGRRVDADDLVALAAVLEVEPADLLRPPAELRSKTGRDHPALLAAADVAARIEAVLEGSGHPGPGGYAARSLSRALNRLSLEIDELLDGQAEAMRQ